MRGLNIDWRWSCVVDRFEILLREKEKIIWKEFNLEGCEEEGILPVIIEASKYCKSLNYISFEFLVKLDRYGYFDL